MVPSSATRLNLTPRNPSAYFVAMPKKQTNPEMEAFAAAHEIGHCLGLIHAVDDPNVPDDKPSIMGDGKFSERIGKSALAPAHIRRVRRSKLLLWPRRDG